ncbi:hypothetical protein N2152v2_009044 [Parachlorella kessleri]
MSVSSFEFPSAAGSPPKAALSQRDTNAEAVIKTWSKPGSRIPAPPQGGFATPENTIKSRSVFEEPLPTPSRCPTEDTLLSVASQLETRLVKEQQALEAGKQGGWSPAADF